MLAVPTSHKSHIIQFEKYPTQGAYLKEPLLSMFPGLVVFSLTCQIGSVLPYSPHWPCFSLLARLALFALTRQTGSVLPYLPYWPCFPLLARLAVSFLTFQPGSVLLNEQQPGPDQVMGTSSGVQCGAWILHGTYTRER